MKRLFVLFSLFACACRSGPPPQWVEGEVPGPSDRVLAEVTRLAMEAQGFHVVVRGFDPLERVASSVWEPDLHPFSGEGFRERAKVRYEPVAPGRILLGVRVERQINKNIARPLELDHADWAEGADNPVRARAILQYIRSTLEGTLTFSDDSASEPVP
ncbi:MAG: hypothetical protein CMJ84_10875 [Planctomycetes bacterium]|jgi:hypothetical protein|nr:hypothetical protein [Planctomycetota bacterium]MDP6408784.1 hypothetical protein [Planctomycetota bacterium]